MTNIILAFLWGAIARALGFSIIDSWQAWALIIAGSASYWIGTLSK